MFLDNIVTDGYFNFCKTFSLGGSAYQPQKVATRITTVLVMEVFDYPNTGLCNEHRAEEQQCNMGRKDCKHNTEL